MGVSSDDIIMQLRGVAIDWDSSWGEQQRLVHWLSIIVHSNSAAEVLVSDSV